MQIHQGTVRPTEQMVLHTGAFPLPFASLSGLSCENTVNNVRFLISVEALLIVFGSVFLSEKPSYRTRPHAYWWNTLEIHAAFKAPEIRGLTLKQIIYLTVRSPVGGSGWWKIQNANISIDSRIHILILNTPRLNLWNGRILQAKSTISHYYINWSHFSKISRLLS